MFPRQLTMSQFRAGRRVGSSLPRSGAGIIDRVISPGTGGSGAFLYYDEDDETRNSREGNGAIDEKGGSNVRREFATELSQNPPRNYDFANDKVYICMYAARRRRVRSRTTNIGPSPRLRTSPSVAFPACTRRPLARGRISPGKAEADAASRGHFPVATR